MSIEAEVEEIAGIKPKGKEARQKYLSRVVKAVEALDDTDWDKLPEDAQVWYKVALKQDGEGDDIDDFPDVAEEPEEPVEAAEADEDAAAEESAEEEDNVSTAKTTKAPAKKSAKPVKAAKSKNGAAPKKAAKRASNGEAFKKVGVMAEIKRMLQRDNGASVQEIMAVLTKKFPERPEKGMETSTRAYIYVAAPKAIGKKLKKVKDEKRGTVFTLPASA